MPTAFKTSLVPDLVARAFAPRPDETIWEWADCNVFFDTTMAPEAGPYRSANTPWTRRIQQLVQHPYHDGRRVHKIVVMKSSQTGFTEAILNCIRWFALFSPRNIIYAIDSREEAGNISDRLIPSLKKLGEDIFTGDDDDEKRYALKLRQMKIWFFGSFSAGRFANKQAAFGVCDEYEEHGRITGDTTSLANLESRSKRSEEGLVIVISKPKLDGGPIHEEFKNGNREIYLVPCPHCGTFQEINFESLQFQHCKNKKGEWDKERVLRETHMRCAATYCAPAEKIFEVDKKVPDGLSHAETRKALDELFAGLERQPIQEHHRPAMVVEAPSRFNPEKKTWEYYGPGARWLGTASGDPLVVSEHMSDLYDPVTAYVWGKIALEIISSKGDFVTRMGRWNHRLGLPWRRHAVRTDRDTILKLRGDYARGTVPFAPWFQAGKELMLPLLIGADVGLTYVRWVVVAVNKDDSMALIDWGTELHPQSIREIVFTQSWPLAGESGKRFAIVQGGMDPKYRNEDVYPACLQSQQKLWPVAGGASSRGHRSFAFGSIPTYPPPPAFGLLTFNDRDFKSELYVERIPNRRLIVPADIEEKRPDEVFDIIQELIAERLEEDRYGNLKWTNLQPNKTTVIPNHAGDALKICCVIWRYMMRKRNPNEK
jgi:hypothetical protein